MTRHRGRSGRPYRVERVPRAQEHPARDSSALRSSSLAGSSAQDLLSTPGSNLILLRAFLGVTFTFAGLQKLANSSFFSSSAPGSFQAQLRGSIITSPLHHLLSPVLHVSTIVAIVISLGEIAVGLGTLLGLFGRAAAFGGALLALSFFLTVSYNASPYYYGADIVFFFAWTPLILGGSGSWSLDALYARRAARERSRIAVTMRGSSASAIRSTNEMERRVFLQRASAAGVVAVSGSLFGGIVAAIGQLVRSPAAPSGTAAIGSIGPSTSSPSSSNSASSSSSTTSTSGSQGTSAPKGTSIGSASNVPVGGAATFVDPALGVPALVVQVKHGSFLAFSAICPHAGCQVLFDQPNNVFACPCHGSIFNASTGAVEQGPAVTGLTPIAISLGPGQQLYVDG